LAVSTMIVVSVSVPLRERLFGSFQVPWRAGGITVTVAAERKVCQYLKSRACGSFNIPDTTIASEMEESRRVKATIVGDEAELSSGVGNFCLLV